MSANSPKEIGRLAGRAFAAVVPKNWAIRSQEDQEDYGVDYEIELTTPTDKATGFIFKVQQKGVEKARRLADGTVSFSGLSTEKVTYYLRQLRIPIVLVVVELESSKSYWISMHANREVEAALQEAVATGNDSITVHLPASNVLPATADELLAAVRLMMDALTLAGLKAMPTANAQAIIDSEPDIDELEKGLRFTQSLLRSTRTQRLIDQGDYERAYELNAKAFADESEPIEVRFTAGMEVVRIGGGIATKQLGHGAREKLLELRFAVHHQLVPICRKLPPQHQLRYYSLFLARTSRLRVHVHRDVGISFSLLAQDANPDDFARYITAGAQRRSTMEVTSELHRAQRLLIQLIDHGWIGLVIYAWADLTEALLPFLTRLMKDGLTAGATAIREWLHSVGTLCRELVVQLKAANLIELCALNHARIEIDTDEFLLRASEASDLIAKIASVEDQRIAKAHLDKLVKLASEKPDDIEPEHDQQGLEQIVRQMAHGLGIDIDDPNDDIARVIRIGLKDANPERVLRDCQHLLVKLGSSGVPAQMLGLPTAGSKYIVCKKHGYRSSNLSLDNLYAFFKASHCDGCADRDPHPPNWKWTLAWQKEQELAAAATANDSADSMTAKVTQKNKRNPNDGVDNPIVGVSQRNNKSNSRNKPKKSAKDQKKNEKKDRKKNKKKRP